MGGIIFVRGRGPAGTRNVSTAERFNTKHYKQLRRPAGALAAALVAEVVLCLMKFHIFLVSSIPIPKASEISNANNAVSGRNIAKE